MNAPLTAVGPGWSHFWRGLRTPAGAFTVRRSMSCPVGHSAMPVLMFSDGGTVLLNSGALDCPRCGRELGLLG